MLSLNSTTTTSLPPNQQQHENKPLNASASLATQLPEILIQIFSYLSQNDLIYSVSPVNRSWNSISANLIHDTLLWKDSSSLIQQEKCLKRLASIQVKTFQCVAQDKRTYAAFAPDINHLVETAWKKLIDTIEAAVTPINTLDPLIHHETFDHTPAATTTSRSRSHYKLLPWKKIIFMEHNCFNERWGPLLEKYPGSFYGLTSLQFKHMTPGILDLSIIFSVLVNLEELSLQSIESSPFSFKRNFTITWNERFNQLEDTQDLGSGSGSGSGSGTCITQDQPIRAMKLCKFNLRHIIINQDTLEMILSGMPSLQSLKLKFLISARNNPLSAVIDRKSFMEFLAFQFPDIAELHFSISREIASTNYTREVLDVLPNVTSLSMLGRDIQLGIPSNFDRLTSLEIEYDDYYNVVGTGLGPILHTYLCQAHSLVHLKAPKTRLIQSNFILELASGAEEREPQYGLTKPIWACRGLKTLHILLDSPGPYTFGRNDMNRRVYGYISRVCPNVEDMVLEWTYLHSDITSGLVLLTRCKKMKHLRIFSSVAPFVTPRDLDWLCLGMIDNSNHPEAQDLRYLIVRDGLLGAISQRFSNSWKSEPGIGGMSKTERESWTQWMIDTLKRKFLEEGHPDQVIRRVENMDGQETEGIISEEMISLSSMEHVFKQLYVLLERSRKSSKTENKVCCWPNLETFTIHKMEAFSIYTEPCKELIWKLRPELKRFHRPYL